MKKVVIVLPTYNEAGNIRSVIEGIFAETSHNTLWDVHVLVVESTSEDNTEEIVSSLAKTYPRLHILRTKKEGLGRAYVRGFEYALKELEAFVIFQMDADLSHDPKKIPAFLKQIENGADFVIGSRYRKGGSIPSDWGIHRKIFSVLGNFVIRFGFMHLKITDWTSGFRAIKAWVIQDALSRVDTFSGYVFQVALLDSAVKAHAKITEVPIQFIDRIEGKSKINSFEYIVQTLFYVMLESSFIKFVIVGGTGFVIDSLILWFLVHKGGMAPWSSKLISAETAIISNFTLNNFWSFSHKSIDGGLKKYLRGLLKFNIVSSGNILIQTIGITILTHMFGTKDIIFFNAGIIILLVIPYSYFVYNRFIWKPKA